MRIILMLLLSTTVWGALPQAFKVEIRHSRTALEYTWDGKKLEAMDRGMKASFELKKCNQKMLEDFFAIEAFHWKNRPAKTPDSIRVKRNTESLLITANSSLGKYLLTLRDQFMLLKAQESMECR